MALETGTYISDLVSTNPVGTDTIDKADDHLRLIKSTVKATFPNISGAVTPTHTELNYVDGVTSAIQTQLDSKSPLASPTFTGTPAAPTAAVDTNTTQLATTAYVVGQGYAKLASPTFTGTPAAPTAAVDTNTTQLATTAYVVGQGYLKSSTASSTYAPLASPALTGTPTAPTAGGGTNTTQIATTAFVTSAVSSAGGCTLLGSVATTSGSSQTISSLNLSGYKFLRFVLVGVSHTAANGSITINGVNVVGGGTVGNAYTAYGYVDHDLTTNVGISALANTSTGNNVSVHYYVALGLTTSSTSVAIATSAGSFDAGSVYLYGYK